jgi:transcriptional regulator with XRE-family HTH domain
LDIKQEQITAARLKAEGLSRAEIAEEMGLTKRQVKSRLAASAQDPAIQAAMNHVGTGMEPDTIWIKDENYSIQLRPKSKDFEDMAAKLISALEDYQPLDRKLFAPRVNTGAKGDKLMVLDLADVHFGKLCTPEETGYDYNVEAARHRVIEGTRELLRRSDDVGRILFVMGNDILHTDNGKSTTSGTPQDTDGTYFNAWRAAQHASIDAILQCAELAEVDLLHCMSNHDWRSGWALSQTIAASVKNHDNVRATPYNLSEKHLKFYGYGRNGLLLSHGDGAKEESLTSLFLKQGKNLVGQCDLLYAYLHHFHHKIRKLRGIDVFQSEKDHTAFTQVSFGAARVEGQGMVAEYIRSPSSPDSWHMEKGYVNRQAVEAFIHCPHEGQKDRLTEWF